ncbi:UNVERIFIED_CONTAM: hypothetical protein RMT77_010612 [Armadillidium vulgare]
MYYIFGVINENWNFRNFLVSEEHDNLKLNNMQEIYQYIINRTNIKRDLYVGLLNMTLGSYLHYKTPLQIQKIISGMAIPRELHIKYNKTITINEEKFSLPLLTVKSRGRLGNLMGEYASLFSLGKLYNASVLLDPKMKKKFKGIFPHITMKVLPSDFDRKKCVSVSFDDSYKDICNYSPIQLAAAGLFGPLCFIITDYPFEMKLFHSIREDIVKEFKFSEQIEKKVEKFYSSIKNTKRRKFNKEHYTFVGIHIRMTDFKHHMQIVFGGGVPSDNYVANAIKYIKRKYRNPIFIAISDDVKRLKEILKNEKNVFYPESTPEVDMAILSFCNHSIFTIGSYGFWASYLAGGEVLYADVKTEIPFTHSTSFYNDANLSNFVHINDIP